MTHHKRQRGWTAFGVAVAVVIGACGVGGGNEPTPDPPPVSRKASRPAAPVTDPPSDRLVISQNGLPGLELNRQVLDVSTSDLETVIGNHDFFNAGQTEDCGLATNESLGLAAVTNSDLAVVAFVVERPDATTREGIRLGSTTEDIIETYGEDEVFARDVRSRSGGQLVWVTDLESPGAEPTASSFHYAFDTDASGTVTRIRAGFWPHVADVDYCSDEATRRTATGWPLT